MNTCNTLNVWLLGAQRFISFFVLAAALCLPQTARAQCTAPQRVGYFETYRGTAAIANIPWKSLTRLNIAFIGVGSEGVATWLNADGKNMPESNMGASVATIRALVAARDANNPGLKLLLSVGGSTMSNHFSQVARTCEGRRILATSAVGVAKNLGLDGVDYDWEYPGRLVTGNCEAGRGKCASSDDFANFTKLLKETRKQAAPGQLLTAAVYYDPSDKGVPYDVAGMDAQLDAWNIMAYDAAAPSWHPQTAFHAGIQLSEQSLTDFASRGATPAKLVLGVPFYGYIWTNVPWAGVNVDPTADQGAHASDQTGIDALFKRYSGTDGCKLFVTNDGDYYYCSYGKLQGEWCAIDSVNVLQQKARYVQEHGYGGMMSWSLSMDTDEQLMSHTIADALK